MELLKEPFLVRAGIIYFLAVVFSSVYCWFLTVLLAYIHDMQVTVYINLFGEAHIEIFAIILFFIDCAFLIWYYAKKGCARKEKRHKSHFLKEEGEVKKK